MKYQGKSDFRHDSQPATGILIVNLGTPTSATPNAVRRYLAEFLSDPRVVETPRLIWRLILHLVILRIRPNPVAKNYAKIWTDEGSPLLVHSKAIAERLQTKLNETLPGPVQVELAMRYGEPSIAAALQRLRDKQVERLLVIPMYPQYSATTTAAIFDEVTNQLQKWRWLPEFRMLMQYHDHPLYTQAIASQIRQGLEQYGQPDKLYLSFHGIPQRYHKAGDPYYCQCHKSARLIMQQVNLPENHWQLCFQSRFGREPWLQPYLDKTLEADATKDVKSAMVIAPGFSADCLETLEELAMQNKELFLINGGQHYHYLPALNESEAHIKLLQALVVSECHGWPEVDANVTPPDITERDTQYKSSI